MMLNEKKGAIKMNRAVRNGAIRVNRTVEIQISETQRVYYSSKLTGLRHKPNGSFVCVEGLRPSQPFGSYRA